MKKYAVMLALVLAGTLVLVEPSAAQASTRVTFTKPTAVRDGAVISVRGRVKGPVKSVRIQKRVGGKWVTARWARVWYGFYASRVPASSTTTTTLRTVASTTGSTTVRVAARRPAPTPSSDSCGVRPAKADGTLWSCSFVDDFNDATLDRSKWVPQTQFATGVQAAHACYLDDPSVVNESGGSLNLTVRKVASPVSCTFGGMSGPTSYVAGGVTTYGLFSQQYGRFEARYKNTATTYPGLHEAFWLWPQDPYATGESWPASGEIDVAETYSTYSNLVIPFLHYGYGLGATPTVNTAWNCAAARGMYNTYTLVWSPTRVEILVNGKSCLVNTSGDPAFKKAYIMSLTQGLGAAGNVYDGRAPLPATMSVDYVKVWR